MTSLKQGDTIRGIDQYKIERFLGSGAFKRAYLARNVTSGARVVLYESLNNKRFANELANYKYLYNKLSNRGSRDTDFCVQGLICPLEFIDDRFIVTNYFNGVTLKEFLGTFRRARRFVPVEKVLNIASSVATAVYVLADKLKFAHADIKPDNVMIDPDTLEVGVIDIGAGCNFNVSRNCAASQLRGTIGYMAPEVMLSSKDIVKGKKEALQRADVFSLGCVVFEMMYSRKPLECVLAKFQTDGMNAIYPLVFYVSNNVSSLEGTMREMAVRDFSLECPAQKSELSTFSSSSEPFGSLHSSLSSLASLTLLSSSSVASFVDEAPPLETDLDKRFFSALEDTVFKMLHVDPKKRIKLSAAAKMLTDLLTKYEIEKSAINYDRDLEYFFHVIDDKNINALAHALETRQPAALQYFYQILSYCMAFFPAGVRELLNAGVSPAVPFPDSAVRVLAKYDKHGHITQELLSHGLLDVSRRFNGNSTALHIAIAAQNLHMVHVLLRDGADPNALDAAGDTALTVALRIPDDRAIALLFRRGNVDVASACKDQLMCTRLQPFIQMYEQREKRKYKRTQQERHNKRTRIAIASVCANLDETANLELVKMLARARKIPTDGKTKKQLCAEIAQKVVVSKRLLD